MDFARPLDLPCRRPVGAADRGDRAYFHRCRGGAAAVGAAAVALSPDLGAGVPVTPAVAAQVHADAATVGDHGGDPAVGDRRRAEPVADARRPPALLLHHCDGLSWRVGAHPPRREISHGFLCRAVVRRHGRRTVRWKLAAVVTLALVLIRMYPSDDGRVETVRSFFGVHKIVVTPNGQYHVLMHGTTIHGAEKFKNDDGTLVTGQPEPITYYHKDGGIGQAITAIRERKGSPLRVAVIGLGSGTLTCASEPGEDWKFFEIDQSMVDTAKDPKYFTFIQNCEPNLKPVIGDARLTFAREPNGIYDLIIVDAYSSDAIPIHLATEEAMEIYKEKLAPQGVVAMHVSNRHLELSSVVVGIADANDMKSWVYSEDSGRDSEYIFSTSVVVSARQEADVGSLASSDQWALTEAEDNQRVWTDDYSNVLGAVWRRLRDGEQ